MITLTALLTITWLTGIAVAVLPAYEKVAARQGK